MYGHLDYDLAVEVGDPVARGQVLGTVLLRGDEPARSHLHFEIRTFLTTPEVNGDAPRYNYACGYQCPPGPGYWPMDASEHPSALGWRNPTHVIARRSYPAGRPPAGAEVVVNDRPGGATALWSAPADAEGTRQVGQIELAAGDVYRLLAIDAGDEATEETSAEAYRLWYRIALPDGERAWVQAAVPSAVETGSDGRPSAVRLDLVPVVPAPIE
jgi:murein DD-endopeptidase MepM/ murein hydrolase activator NlpD